MNDICHICLESAGDGDAYHPRCLRALFSTTRAPLIDLELAKLHTAALAMIGRTSISGIQRKISVSLSGDRQTLQVAAEGGRYILKPQTQTFPALPENEHATTQLARLSGIDVAPFGMVTLKDGSLAYIVRRFDRLTDGRKLRQEDFCQLAELAPKEKYDGSAELCVRLLRKFASEPLIEILKLYRMLVFAWWSGNGDLHLKNLSMLIDEHGIARLSPAYDLISTRLVIPDDPLALPVAGKKDRLDRDDWLNFAGYCQLPERAAVGILQNQAAIAEAALGVIDRSFLPMDQKATYTQLIANRTGAI